MEKRTNAFSSANYNIQYRLSFIMVCLVEDYRQHFFTIRRTTTKLTLGITVHVWLCATVNKILRSSRWVFGYYMTVMMTNDFGSDTRAPKQLATRKRKKQSDQCIDNWDNSRI